MEEGLSTPRARRIWGLTALALLAALALWSTLGRRPDAAEAAIRRGIVSLLDGLAESGAVPAAAHDAFSDALRANPFDPYPAFLLRLAERLDSPATIDPERGPFERALALVRAGRHDEARLLLMKPGVARPGGSEELLIRFLHDARLARSGPSPPSPGRDSPAAPESPAAPR